MLLPTFLLLHRLPSPMPANGRTAARISGRLRQATAAMLLAWLAAGSAAHAQPAAETSLNAVVAKPADRLAPARPAAACPAPPRVPSLQEITEQQRTAIDRGFLWRMTRDGRTSYLYGTLHVGRFEWLVPGPAVTQAVRTSDVLAMELDLTDPATLKAFAAASSRGEERPLPAALRQRVETLWTAACLDAKALPNMAPEFVAMTLTLVPVLADGLSPAYGVDMVLAGMAKALQKRVVALETVQSQLALLQLPTDAERVQAVRKAIEGLDTGAARTQGLRLARIWGTGNYAELARYAEWCDCLNTAQERKAMKALLDDRNLVMAERIDVLHRRGASVFAAVGSLHMAGRQALPDLMRKRGYTVDAVPMGPAAQ